MHSWVTLDDALLHLGPRLEVGRVILGIAGPPAVGKSTVAERARAWAMTAGWPTVVVPMDGFHLAQSVLDERGLADVKGAPHTFDGAGYAALLHRLRTQGDDESTIWAPSFDRSTENAIAGSIGVTAEHRLVITEGNYLLLEDGPWPTARAQVDECWYLELPDDVRRERLTARHRDFGRSLQQATERANGSDEANARLVAAVRHTADLVVRTG